MKLVTLSKVEGSKASLTHKRERASLMKWFVFAVILVFQVCLFSLTVYKITNSEQSKNIQYVEIAIAILVLFGFIAATTYKTVTPSLANAVNNANTEDETAKATEKKAKGIRARMCDIIFEEFKHLVKEQVAPWVFFRTGKFRIKKFDGGCISYSGIEFEGSPRLVFWQGCIEPFVEDVIKRMIEETIRLAKDKNVQLSAVLGSTKANLSGGIRTLYSKMQEVDRRLRGKGYPKSVPKRDVSFEVKKMNDFLDRQIKIAEDLHFEIHKTGKVEKK